METFAQYDVAQWNEFVTGYTERVFCPTAFDDVCDAIVEKVRLPRVLDLGCGPTGLLLHRLLRLPGIELHASDFSGAMIEEAKRALREDAKRVAFTESDSRRMALPAETFDTVISVNSILPETRSDVDQIFSEVHRILKVQGRFVALMPAFETSLMARDQWNMDIRIDEANHREFDTTGWQCFYTREDVEELFLSFGFRVVTLRRHFFRSADQIEAIRRVYGRQLSVELLSETPLFEHFVVGEKTTSAARGNA